MPKITWSKYAKIELIFFVVYFYIFSFLTDFEYNFWERKKTGISFYEVEYNLLHGTVSILAFWIFYQIIKRYLLHKKTGLVIFLITLFLVSYTFYSKLVYYVFAHLDFLSDRMRQDSARNFNFRSLGYSFAYMFREFLSVGFLAYFIHADQQNERLKALKEQQMLAEITYLKAQLQPHFFFNTLNNIYGLALQQSPNTAPMIAKLAEMMRYILYHSDKKSVPLTDEIAFVENYVAVEKVRYRKAIQIEFEAQGINESIEISPLLFLPFIENAFKHGIQDEQNEGFVKILVLATENELIMEVANSVAITKSVIGGIGLANVKKRLDLLYPQKYTLDLANNEEMFKVILTLNIND